MINGGIKLSWLDYFQKIKYDHQHFFCQVGDPFSCTLTPQALGIILGCQLHEDVIEGTPPEALGPPSEVRVKVEGEEEKEERRGEGRNAEVEEGKRRW